MSKVSSRSNTLRTAQVHERQVDFFGGGNPAFPTVFAAGATALR